MTGWSRGQGLFAKAAGGQEREEASLCLFAAKWGCVTPSGPSWGNANKGPTATKA